MVEIKHKSASFKNTVSISDIFRKRVYAKDGSVLGTVGEVHIHPKRLTVEGITLQKGYFISSDYIGKNYISSLNKKGAMLSINPFTELIGKTVIDSSGKKIGTVKKLSRTRKTNNVNSLVVSGGFGHKDLFVRDKDVRSIGKRIILKSVVK